MNPLLLLLLGGAGLYAVSRPTRAVGAVGDQNVPSGQVNFASLVGKCVSPATHGAALSAAGYRTIHAPSICGQQLAYVTPGQGTYPAPCVGGDLPMAGGLCGVNGVVKTPEERAAFFANSFSLAAGAVGETVSQTVGAVSGLVDGSSPICNIPMFGDIACKVAAKGASVAAPYVVVAANALKQVNA
jgi:hypothetical protein